MSADTGKRMTSQQADAIYENLDFAQVIQQYGADVELSARNAVSRYYEVLAEMHAARISYEKMSQFLAETFDFVITPKTLREYMRLERQLEKARNSKHPVLRSKARSRKSPASTPVQAEATVVPAPPVQSPEPSQPPPIVTTKPVAPIVTTPTQPVVSTEPPAAKSALTKSSGARSQLLSVVPSGDAEDVPIAEFSPEELEAALQIPEPGDKAAMEKFLQALKQLKTIDPGRWQELRADAKRAGVNVLGIVTPSASHLFNQY